MTSCEKLRARKRFFANKVDEINNPPPPLPPRAPSPVPAAPLLGIPSPQHAEAVDPSPTSLDGFAQAMVRMHASNGPASLPPSDQMRLVESWFVSPPVTRVPSPAAPPRTAAHDSEPSGGYGSAATGSANVVSGVDVVMMEASAAYESFTGSASMSQAHAELDASKQGSQQRAQGICKPDNCCDMQEGANADNVEASISRPSLNQSGGARARAEVLPLLAEHQVIRPDSSRSMHVSRAQGRPASRPSSSHSMQSAQRAQHMQHAHHPSSSPSSLLWGEGVRAPAGVALAIGPWAHTTSGPAPVPTQALLEAAEQAALHADHFSHRQQHQSCDHMDGLSTAQAACHMAVDDQVAAAQEAVDTAEAVGAVMTRATTPDDDGGSSSQMCNVCLCPIRQLIIVLQPCGHYYCESCTASLRGVAYPRCPECRTRISSTFRVPLSSSHTHTLKEDAQHAQVRFTHSADREVL